MAAGGVPRASRGKLRFGVSLALLTPEWNRPCSVCESYIWKQNEPGRLQRTADGTPVERTDKNLPLRCMECPKVPKWAKEAGKNWKELRELAAPDMTPENQAAFDFYRECRAIGTFPDDDLVRWYSAIIRDVWDEADRRPVERQTAAIKGLCDLIALRTRGR